MNPPRVIVEPSGPTPGRIFLGVIIAVLSILLVLPLLAIVAMAGVIVFGAWWVVATAVMRVAALMGRDGEGRRNVRVRR